MGPRAPRRDPPGPRRPAGPALLRRAGRRPEHRRRGGRARGRADPGADRRPAHADHRAPPRRARPPRSEARAREPARAPGHGRGTRRRRGARPRSAAPRSRDRDDDLSLRPGGADQRGQARPGRARARPADPRARTRSRSRSPTTAAASIPRSASRASAWSGCTSVPALVGGEMRVESSEAGTTVRGSFPRIVAGNHGGRARSDPLRTTPRSPARMARPPRTARMDGRDGKHSKPSTALESS